MKNSYCFKHIHLAAKKTRNKSGEVRIPKIIPSNEKGNQKPKKIKRKNKCGNNKTQSQEHNSQPNSQDFNYDGIHRIQNQNSVSEILPSIEVIWTHELPDPVAIGKHSAHENVSDKVFCTLGVSLNFLKFTAFTYVFSIKKLINFVNTRCSIIGCFFLKCAVWTVIIIFEYIFWAHFDR